MKASLGVRQMVKDANAIYEIKCLVLKGQFVYIPLDEVHILQVFGVPISRIYRRAQVYPHHLRSKLGRVVNVPAKATSSIQSYFTLEEGWLDRVGVI